MSIELLPTKENIKSTLSEDLICRNESLYYFLELLNGLEGPTSISLNGYWGSGKTFFVKQAEYVLNTINEFTGTTSDDDRELVESCFGKISRNWSLSNYAPQVAVYYDSWANDNDIDPILSIVYTIIKTIDVNYSLEESPSFLKIAGSIADCITGREITKVFEGFKGSNPLSAIKEQHDLTNLIKVFLSDIIKERGNRLVIFVDELDRCRPQYAVQLLERVKHYFGTDNVTFVFSVNVEELQHTVKQFYGEGFNAGRYLDRFFDIRVSLPPAKIEKFYQKIGLSNGTWVYEKNCCKVIDMCHLELREITRFYSIAKMAAYKPMHENRQFLFSDGKATQYNLLYIAPLLIGLQLSDLRAYEDFISGKDGTPLKKLIMSDDWCQHTMSPFISRDKTFDENSDQQKCVKVEDVIQEWYEAVFCRIYDNRTYSYTMGELEFNKEHKIELLNTISLLSHFASFDS